MTSLTERAVDAVYRDNWTAILATLVRETRDLDAAEDALQEAMARAIASWPRDGVPANPAGWVSITARRIAIDAARRASAFQDKLPLLVVDDEPDASLHAIDLAFGDDRLRLIFTCCHPLLSQDARLALTLRLVCGLPTADIAALFLVPETTMAARITRAKNRLTASGAPYQIPSPEDIETRLNDVLAVVYLVATAGHTASSGTELHNTTHMQLALTLTRVLCELVPRHPEVLGLRALVLLAEARKDSRLDPEGTPLTLEHMDRSLWNRQMIADGVALTETSLRISKPETVGPFALQAAIAAVHAEAATYDDTDWAQIVALYAVLNHRHGNAVTRLGYAVAVGMHEGPEVGLKMIDTFRLDEALPSYPMLPAARADLLRRSGRNAEAVEEYQRAATLSTNQTLARWFMQQAEVLMIGSEIRKP
ncbi:MAG: hypothetical protein M9953_07465 [Thermomicrobiales bacterium]|nr:hypothetical protein [Thermomicrobiales bacterium]